jgi:hypothetical protein
MISQDGFLKYRSTEFPPSSHEPSPVLKKSVNRPLTNSFEDTILLNARRDAVPFSIFKLAYNESCGFSNP